MAKIFSEVVGIEISERRCDMAAHNATVYGVQANTSFLCSDFFAAASTLIADAIFVSPPWGGPKYQVTGYMGKGWPKYQVTGYMGTSVHA